MAEETWQINGKPIEDLTCLVCHTRGKLMWTNIESRLEPCFYSFRGDRHYTVDFACQCGAQSSLYFEGGTVNRYVPPEPFYVEEISMGISQVSYARLKNTGNYQNERVECTYVLDTDETPSDGLRAAKRFVAKALKDGPSEDEIEAARQLLEDYDDDA